MRANRRRDTRPELRLRRLLHGRGMRYRVDHRVELPSGKVRVDIAFPRRRVAVFVDGCFWHGCPEHGTSPRSNAAYWRAKLARNRDRDRRNDQELGALGWQVIRIWEHESPQSAADSVIESVRKR
jgi:DNA mismatch endonuclease, patch repair protein